MKENNLKAKQILGLAHENHRKNNLKLAEELYNKILKISPNHVDTLYLLGTLYIQKKEFIKATKMFDAALKINPKHVDVLHNLGYIFMETGKHEKAKKLLLEVIEIKPDHIDGNYNLGNLYKYFGESDIAEKYFKKAIKIKPNDPKFHNNLGNVLKDQVKFDDAIKSYNKAIELKNNHVNAYHNLGNTYKQLGQFKKAKNYYLKALEFQPLNLETLFTKIELNKETIDVKLKKKINEFMDKKNLSQKDYAYGNFILARHELQNRNFEKEFDHLLKGHSHYYQFGKIKYDRGIDYWFNQVQNNKELMNLLELNKNAKKFKDKIKPIFIVGVPRCGSTVIEKVIASGKKHIPIGEETAIVSLYMGETLTANKSIVSNIELMREKILKRYKLRGLIKKESDYIFTDKSLDNFFFIGLIKEMFPYSKIINCKRNEIASIMSILKNNLGDVSWAHNLEHIFRYFDIYLKIIEKYKKMYPNFIYELKLEKFVENPEDESKKLLKFCELPWDKKCLEFYKRKDLTSRTASNIQIRQAIYKVSDEKYKPYEMLLDRYGSKYDWFKKK